MISFRLTVNKVMKISVCVSLLACSAADVQSDWRHYKKEYNKTYSPQEDANRFNIYRSNLRKIHNQNKLFTQGTSGHYAGENEYTDWSDSEYQRMLMGPIDISNDMNSTRSVGPSNELNGILPENLDWRKMGYVTSVKNQGFCFSCYAFGVAGVMEGQYSRITGRLISFSASNLVDCSLYLGNHGCKYGYTSKAYKYVVTHGLNPEEYYPYAPRLQKCKYSKAHSKIWIRTYARVHPGNEEALKRVLAKTGPVLCSMYIDHAFQIYKGGIFRNPACKGKQINHSMLLVGYGRSNGEDYWLIKNSWGPHWGEKGYIRLIRNHGNECNIASLCSIAIGVKVRM